MRASPYTKRVRRLAHSCRLLAHIAGISQVAARAAYTSVPSPRGGCLRLGHPQQGGHAPLPLGRQAAGRRRALLGNLLQLAVVAHEPRHKDRDDGEEGDEDKESREAGGGETDAIDNLLR